MFNFMLWHSSAAALATSAMQGEADFPNCMPKRVNGLCVEVARPSKDGCSSLEMLPLGKFAGTSGNATIQNERNVGFLGNVNSLQIIKYLGS